MKIKMNEVQKKRFDRWVKAAKRRGIIITINNNIVRCEAVDNPSLFSEYDLDAILKSFDLN